MRFGVMSDVHGNLAGLNVAVSTLQKEGIDVLLCAGDLVGYGPQPNECIARLAELGTTCVAGNHDLLALGLLDGRQIGSLARATQDWTRRTLGSAEKAYLATLPLVVEVAEVVLAHGSLDDPEVYVWPRDGAAAQLHLAAQRYPSSRFLVLGHTHRQALVDEREGPRRVRSDRVIPLRPDARALLNPGSTGQSRERERRPRVRFAILDTDRRVATPFTRDYDASGTLELLAEHNLPAGSLHMRPTSRSIARRALRRSHRMLRRGGTNRGTDSA